ncbi:MAG: hypothetical protein FWD78_14325 [Treponema sp.]|nr:hypothetical protein [Treponema sp.]
MKKIILMCIALALAFGIIVPGAYALDDFFAGIGPDINGHGRQDFAVGGDLLFGMDLNPQFSAGLRAGFYHDLYEVFSMEPQAFFRYNLPFVKGLFVQAEAGCVVYLDYGSTYPAFSGGLSAGWRLPISGNFYVEPAARFGYPYMWGINIMVEYIFPLNKEAQG